MHSRWVPHSAPQRLVAKVHVRSEEAQFRSYSHELWPGLGTRLVIEQRSAVEHFQHPAFILVQIPLGHALASCRSRTSNASRGSLLTCRQILREVCYSMWDLANVVLADIIEGYNKRFTVQTWGEFQSIIQLSIALNAAFAALSSFIGTSLTREKRLLEELIDRLQSIGVAGQSVATVLKPAYSPKTLKIEIRGLVGESVRMQHRYDGLINRYLRPVCIVASLAGLVFIIVSSFLYKDEIGIYCIALSCSLLFPFAAGALLSLHLSWRTYARISARRKEHEAKFV